MADRKSTMMPSPCAGQPVCPFRKDCMQGWLARRAVEIVQANSFVCHKDNSKQCAGHILVSNQSIFARLGARKEVKGQELVFDSPEAFIAHHTAPTLPPEK